MKDLIVATCLAAIAVAPDAWAQPYVPPPASTTLLGQVDLAHAMPVDEHY